MEIQSVKSVYQPQNNLNGFASEKIKLYDEVQKGFSSSASTVSFSNIISRTEESAQTVSNESTVPSYGMDIYKNYLSVILESAQDQSQTAKSAEKAQTKVVQDLEQKIRQSESPFLKKISTDIFTHNSDVNPIFSAWEELREKISAANQNKTLLTEKLKAYRIAREAGSMERQAMTAENTIRLVA